METVQVALPHGAVAQIRSLRGRDELELVETADRTPPAALATALLARCLVRLGDDGGPGEDAVRGLVFGDREALLLHLRRHTFGERIRCVVACPACGQRMDLDLTVAQLLDRPVPPPYRDLEAASGAGGQRCRARFRLPRAGDVEVSASAAAHDPDAAARMLLARCLDGVEVAGSDSCEQVPSDLIAAIEERMVEADPFAETVLSLGCPECGHEFRLWFDPADYLFRELGAGRTELFEEIHLLALHYHWSESDILDLPRGRRRMYLRLLAETLGEA